LLSTYERKTAFSAIYRPKRARNRPIFCCFCLFRTAVKVYMTSRNLYTTTPGPGTSPASSRRAKQFWRLPARSLALSKCRPRASRLLPRHDVSPPSLLLVARRSYMTSRRTTMSIFIAARIRVKLSWDHKMYPVDHLYLPNHIFTCLMYG
jgi:hypothetical protein